MKLNKSSAFFGEKYFYDERDRENVLILIVELESLAKLNFSKPAN